MSQRKQLAVNLLGNFAVFVGTFLMSFFLSPYIVKTIGMEANGFVQLANNFVMYATLITVALNSMAGRFITIELYQNNLQNANGYYTSVYFGNLLLALIMIVPAILCVVNINHIVAVPNNILFDVKILFSLIFANFFIELLFPVWTVTFFSTNKLHLQSVGNIIQLCVRIIIIIVSFFYFTSKIWYIGLATISATILFKIWTYYCKKNLLPVLVIKLKYANWDYIKQLLASGVWNSVSNAGTILLINMDLLICNLLFGSSAMGLMALSKIVYTAISSLEGQVNKVFAPNLTINYAKGDFDGIAKELKHGVKILGMIICLPIGIFLALGESFFKLWVPTEDSKILYLLSSASCLGYIFVVGIGVLWNVFSTVNKLKGNAIVLIVSGIVGSSLAIILSKTSLGIFGIPIAMATAAILKNIFYVIPVSGKLIKKKWHTFFPEVFYSISGITSTFLFSKLRNLIFPINSWISFLLTCCFASIGGFIINCFILLRKPDRVFLFNLIKCKMRWTK